ncbi:MAG: hypothetical protein AAGA54_06235 [Myxococcota bacterium]
MDCAAVLDLAADDLDAAAVLPVLCPDAALDAVTARTVLLSADSSDAARRRVPLLAPFPELASLAKLVALVDAPADVVVDARLPDPATAIVTPLSDEVLATAALARAQLHAGGLGPEARARARGYLAKVYAHALRQLGIEPTRPPGPFGRLLAAQAIAHGRAFCAAYWHRRVRGLHRLCTETERAMLRAVLALEADASTGDVPLAAHELVMGRRYLLRSDVKARLAKSFDGETGPLAPSRLAPIAAELPRLMEHGLIDLAIGRALTLRKQGNLSVASIEGLLQQELGAAEGDEYVERLHKRVENATKRGTGTATGTLEHAPDPTWPSASVVARGQLEAIEAADDAFTRRYALARAVVVLRRRPDALRIALDRARRAPDPAVASAVPLLRATLDELDDGRLAYLRRQVATDDAVVTPAEGVRRRSAALIARDAGDAAR